MKTYSLYFVHGDSAYVFNAREDEIILVIMRELKDGALLACIKEVK